MDNIFRTVFIIFFVLSSTLFAVEVDRSSIYQGSYYIQVGAFKNISNIEKVKERLSEYEIYLQPYKNLHRVQVVNITDPDELKETLGKLRKIYPSAFVSKRPDMDKDNREMIKENSENINQLFEPSSDKIENIDTVKPPLDSNSILKTRKRFL